MYHTMLSIARVLMIFYRKSITGRLSAVISAYYAEQNNDHLLEGKGRQTAFMQ